MKKVIRVDEKLHKKLKAKAAIEGQTISGYVEGVFKRLGLK